MNKKIGQATDRTVDMFSGKTNEQLKEEAIADDNIETKHREPPSVEALDKRLTQVMSEKFSQLEGFRLTGSGTTWVLERVRNSGTAYTGMVMSSKDIYELSRLFLEAVKEIDNV